MVFIRKKAGRVAGITIAVALLKKLGLKPTAYVHDGDYVIDNTILIKVYGTGEQVHTGWKTVQLILEWCCGVSQYTAEMRANAKRANPSAIVCCTRKTIPGTRKLATVAVLAGGGHIHRAGISETILIFTNHRRLCSEPENYISHINRLRIQAPENKITVEADSLDNLEKIIQGNPDIIQLDKFSLQDVTSAVEILKNKMNTNIMLSVAGGINKENIYDYARIGVNLFITSAPYYAQPDDIKVIITAN